jgi:hypothetical protein
MSKAKVLIPEDARPDVVAPLIRRPVLRGKGCGKEGGKDGGDKNKEIGKDDKLRPTEGGHELDSAAEHAAL